MCCQPGKLNASAVKSKQQQSCLERPLNPSSCCTNCSTSSVLPASNYFPLSSVFLFQRSQRKIKQPKLTAQKKAKGSYRQTSDGRRTTLCQVLHGHEELLPARMTAAPAWSVGDLILPVFWCLWWHFTAVLLHSAPHRWGLQNVFHSCVVPAWGTPGDANRNKRFLPSLPTLTLL